MPVPHHGEREAQEEVLVGLRAAVALSAVILAVEAVGAVFSRSLSLTVDTVHNIPDILAFAISYTALRSTRHGSSDEFTFGTHRLEVFAGLFNGLLVLATGVGFGLAAGMDLYQGRSFAGPIDAVWLVAVAAPTLGLRLANLRVLGRIPARARDLNLRSVVVHLASDLAITGAILVAGVVLLVRPADAWADPVAALFVAAVLVREAWPLLREGWEVLTERTPRGLSVDAITRSALAEPGVTGLHDVHVWSLCSTLVCMTAHVGVKEMSLHQSVAVVERLRGRMEREFGIVHSTFEVEAPPG